jgi:protein SOK2
MMAGAPGSHPAGIQHHHSMSGGMPSQVGQMQHSIAPHPGSVRPNMDRAHTFPTPPTSASSIIGGSNGSSYDWSAQNMGTGVQNPSQPLAIETGLANNRSMPSTPATTPPSTAGMHNNMQGYPAQQSYDTSRAMYSTAPQAQGQYATQQQNLARFSQPGQGSYMRNDMGPPSRANGEAEQPEIKQDPYGQGQGNEQVTENDHEGEGDYSQDANAAYNASRGSYTYGASSSMNGMPGDHAHMSQDSVNGSPHQNGSGRATPRTSSSQPQWAAGYNTPPRTATSSSLYSVSSLTNGHSDVYGSYPAVNGTSNKRGRDDDDDYKSGADIESLKRRRSGREGSISAPMPAYNHAQSSTIIRSGGRR